MKEFFLSILAAGGIDSPNQLNIPQVGADKIISGLLGTVYWAAGIVAVIVLIVGGILYVTSNGDAGKVKRAKDAILYSIVGLVVVMMAFVITNFIVEWF